MAMKALLTLSLVLSVATATQYWLISTNGTLSIYESEYRPTQNIVARAIYNATFAWKGWDFLQVTARPTASISLQQAYYYAGYLEGFITANAIKVFYPARNYYPSLSDAAKKWISDHVLYLKAQTADPQGAYWTQIAAQLQQLSGLAVGYSASGVGDPLSFDDVFRFNFRYEYGDVEEAVSSSQSNSLRWRDRMRLRQHCSALIKVAPSDLFTSQITWGGYDNMALRQYKIYDINTRVSFSGFALQTHSGDDWYMTSNKLATQETTNDYYFPQLARLFVRPASVSEFLRVMAANFLSKDGREWVETFVTNHSGTYCNQYMVVDYNRYTAGDVGTKLQKGLLWVVEEMPGDYEYADVTDVLRRDGYWASYNIPYFERIYQMSGFEAMYLRFGDFFSYTKYARPRIFRARQSSVVDLNSMMFMMQYNNYSNDPLSIITNCTGCNPPYSPLLSIAARGDLVSPNASLPLDPQVVVFYQRSAFGAIDAKITSAALIQKVTETAWAFSGPTPQQKIFRWSDFGTHPPPGAPDAYNFSWVLQQAYVL